MAVILRKNGNDPRRCGGTPERPITNVNGSAIMHHDDRIEGCGTCVTLVETTIRDMPLFKRRATTVICPYCDGAISDPELENSFLINCLGGDPSV